MSKLVRKFVATANNYTTAGYEALKAWAVDNCKYAVIGKEVGESGTPHLQCYFMMQKAKRITAITKALKTLTGKAVHCELAKGTNEQAAKYCQKDGVFWEHGCYPKSKGERTDIKTFFEAVKRGATDRVLAEEYPREYAKYHAAGTKLRKSMKQEEQAEKVKQKYNEKPLRKWQKHAVEKLEKQDDRKILWIHDSQGNLGKSWLGNWLVANKNAFLVEGGKNADIAEAYDYQKIVVFDYTRCQEERVNYAVIESFKNGRIFSPKYESKMKIFESCQVLCLSNFDPDREKLSADRWQVITYDGPHKKTWLELVNEKPELKRTYCEATPLEYPGEEEGQEPPKKKRRTSIPQQRQVGELTFCDLCMDGLYCPLHD